jgi:putative nucleotidyltransferase with HDIG domain
MITREEAIRLINKHVQNPNLIKHMIAVSAIMRGIAEHLEEDIALWEAVGLLHDIDYEMIGDNFDEHGLISAQLIRNILPDDALHAIQAHNSLTGIPEMSKMDTALIAADSLSGLIVATALMMPDKKLATVKLRSLKKKFKDGSFARNINRVNIKRCNDLGLSLNEFFALGLTSMQTVRNELNL